jgi:hypothetical protein
LEPDAFEGVDEKVERITEERGVRIDADIPAKLSKSMVPDKLFHEVSL